MSCASSSKVSGQASTVHACRASKGMSTLGLSCQCTCEMLPDVQGPIYKAIEWLDHEGMDLIEQASFSG